MSSLFQAGLSPGCVTGVGSLPFIDPDEAVAFVAEQMAQMPDTAHAGVAVPLQAASP